MSARLRFKRELTKALSLLCLKTTSVRQNGVLVSAPLIHGVGASNHVPVDKRTVHFLRIAAEAKGGLALDVGANVGMFLIQLHSLRWFDRGGQYLGFEPNPLCAHYVNEVSRLNQLRSADCLCVALSDDTSVPVLFGHRPADKMASLTADFAYRKHRPIDFSSRVIAEKGDDLLARMGSPEVSILKIDVEGHEGDVIAGMAKTLEVSRPWILCEMWDLENRLGKLSEADKRRRMSAFGVLQKAGYVALDLDMVPLPLSDISADEFCRLGGADLIFIPAAELNKFEAAWQSATGL